MKLILQSILQTVVWTLICGLLYPLVMTLVCQGLFPAQANGSLVYDDKGKLIGSSLLAQQFSGPTYFWPRPSATSPAYSTMPSGASNLGPTSKSLHDNVLSNAKSLRDANKLPADAPVPADLVFTSASGLDPHISPEAARFQIGRVAAARGIGTDKVGALVDKFIEPSQWGVFGEPRVNVLLLNLELDKEMPAPAAPAASPTPATAPAAAAPASPAPAATSTPAPTTG